MSLLLGLLVILVITAATGYFVAQEFAYMAVDRSRLKARAAAGDKAAGRALDVTRRTSFMLSGAQLGITVTALLVGYVAEPLVGKSLGTALGGVGVPTGVGIVVGTVSALLLSTFVQMLFGELFPKNLAISRPEPVAVWLARSTQVYLRVFGWIIAFFDKSSNALLRLFGMEPVHDVEHAASRRDLEYIVSESRDSGDLPAELSMLLDRVLDFPDRDAAHAMVPRARVDVVEPDLTTQELWATMAGGHSRYPVLDERDDVIGVVHLADLLAVDRDAARTVADIMRPPVLVPTSMPLPRVVQTLTERRAQLACVLDEHGGLAGVVTVEDLAEELVGEIEDEHDDTTVATLPVGPADGAWELAGQLPLDEVERIIGHDLPESDSETLAGLVIELIGELPAPGATAELSLDAVFLTLEVMELERHVPSLVRLRTEENR
ncbi:hemolysin family protein [Micromonospora profundi]|uniref:Hemolysin family protein n=1 Tax=Micromonospora profundi TaxID=1420889 RepID=A0AAJ6HZC6_9ACTN|nr:MULTISPECIES: hemolysin family protein [Micromonospora]KOX15024.1 membrane protein [Micromonospora sp. NRRL B-16802]WLS47134.1 hemolysin family protein [Micromonospora profundi]